MSGLRTSGVNPIDREKLLKLRAAIGSGPVLITSHVNPDPDSLAAGKALAQLLSSAWGIASRLVYSGLVGRAENKTMLHLLTPEWEHEEVLPSLDHYSGLALVDSQPGAGNNNLPRSLIPDIVFDHHYPLRQELDLVPFADVRTDVGATSSMVYQYLVSAKVELNASLATAIFYGIQADTRSLSRGSTRIDQEVYFSLLGKIDRQLLIQIEQAGLPRDYFKAFSKGLQAAHIYNRVVVSYLGALIRPDFVAEMADLLIRLENTHAAMCLGYHGGTMYISLRTMMTEDDAGSLIQKVIVSPGTAGGHTSMAGGQMPLSDQAPDVLALEIEKRFLEAMGETGQGDSLL